MPASSMDAYAAGWYVLTPMPPITMHVMTRARLGMMAPAQSATDARRNPNPMRRSRPMRSDHEPVIMEATAVMQR